MAKSADQTPSRTSKAGKGAEPSDILIRDTMHPFEAPKARHVVLAFEDWIICGYRKGGRNEHYFAIPAKRMRPKGGRFRLWPAGLIYSKYLSYWQQCMVCMR